MADLDLIKLIPEKFHTSEILIEYMSALGDDLTEIDSQDKLYNAKNWLDLITALQDEINPRTIDVQYLRNLAALINLELLPEDTTPESTLRSSISEAIDWYKIKGTYSSLDTVALINSVTFNIWDLYTKDYITFERAEWFVGASKNDNPPEYPFSEGYYKSPHFGVEIVLNRVYPANETLSDPETPNNFLWHPSFLTNIQTWVEQTRPVHSVPRYNLLMTPTTDNNGSITTVDGDIQTETQSAFVTGGKTFDQNASPSSDFGGEDIADWTFDENQDSDGDSQTLFDQASQATLLLIDTYKIGTGSKGINLDDSEWDGDIEDGSPTEGSISQDDITDYDDRTEILITIAQGTSLDGVSELGIYTDGGESDEEIVIASLFPDIFKDTNIELQILVTINKV